MFLDQGSNPGPLHWKADSQPLDQGNPHELVFLPWVSGPCWVPSSQHGCASHFSLYVLRTVIALSSPLLFAPLLIHEKGLIKKSFSCPGFPSWASGLRSSPQPWLLESAYSYFVPHAQMWACVPTQGWPRSGEKEGSQRAPGVSLGVRACGRAPLPLLAQLGWRGEGQVCWVPPHLQFGCPSSSLELGRSPLPAPECEALGVLICLPSVPRR